MRHIVRWLLACRENEAELSKKRMARGFFTRVGSDRIEMHTDAVAYRVSYHNRDRKHKVVLSVLSLRTTTGTREQMRRLPSPPSDPSADSRPNGQFGKRCLDAEKALCCCRSRPSSAA